MSGCNEARRIKGPTTTRRSLHAVPHLAGPVGLLAVLTSLVSCGDSSTTSVGDARRDLRAAIEKTLVADSVHVEISSSSPAGEDDPNERSSIDVNAPDRIRSVSGDGSDEHETIAIGTTVYTSDFTRPGFYTSFEQPKGGSSSSNLLAPLRLFQDADEVTHDGADYAVSVGGEPPTTATVSIDGGYVTRLRMRAGKGKEATDVLYEFSRFGSAARVVAPPADKVTKAPFAPECDDKGRPPEGLICTGGNVKEPQEIDLPAVPDGVKSTLQFRPVKSEGGSGCGVRDTNPIAGEPVAMQDPGGGCLELSEAALEVGRVKSLSATAVDAEVTLDVTLLAVDAQRFDALAAENIGKRVAVVILGRVVSAPIIQATEFEGRLQINGLSMEDASRVKAALAN